MKASSTLREERFYTTQLSLHGLSFKVICSISALIQHRYIDYEMSEMWLKFVKYFHEGPSRLHVIWSLIHATFLL